jgi:hypothetical protein
MRYKLLEQDRLADFIHPNSTYVDYGYYTFEKFSSPKKARQYVYDIEVEDNHNFVVCSKSNSSGIVAHNCNRAPSDVIQCLFPFVQSGSLHTHQLPDGWRIIAAGNYQSDRFNTTDTSDAAWMSRFCHIDFTPTTEEWIVHVEDHGMLDIAAFVREQPSMLELSAKNGGRFDSSFVVPDRRAMMDGVGKLELDPEFPEHLKYEVYSGLIGTASAAAFISFKAKREKSLVLGHILSDYTRKAKPRIREITSESETVRFDLLNQPIEELLTRLESNKQFLSAANFLSNLKEFLVDIPKELSMKTFVRLGKIGKFYGKDDLLNDPKYVSNFK